MKTAKELVPAGKGDRKKRSPERWNGAVTVLIVIMAAGYIAAQAGSEVLAKLGLNPSSAGASYLEALTSGYLSYEPTAIKAFKAMPPSARAEVVRAGLAWVKNYTASPEFQTAYQKERESLRPRPPEPVPSAEEQIAKIKADLEKGLENMRKLQATADAEMKKSLEDAIKQTQAQMEEIDKDPQMKENFRLGAEIQRKAGAEQYEKNLKTWNENLPEDPRTLVAKRIRQFLETSADVDYGAELTPRGKKIVFVKEAYEQKSVYWKICFRAGKEATEAARAFASTWLAELEKN